jgi:hypothetical protein
LSKNIPVGRAREPDYSADAFATNHLDVQVSLQDMACIDAAIHAVRVAYL